MVKPLTIGRVLYDFCKWSTIVCLNKIVTSPKWMAVTFTIIFFAMFGLFIFTSVNCILSYLSWPSSTEVAIDVESTPFPRFSFCIENPMKRSVVDTLGPYSEIAKLIRQYELIERNLPTDDDFELRTTRSRLQRQQRAKLMLRLLMAKLSPEDRMKAGYNFTEIVGECTFGGEICTSSDFSPGLHPEYGVCYTFNGNRTVVRPGKKEGLRMLITVNQDFPTVGKFDFLPTTETASAMTLIYDDPNFPDFTKDGIKASSTYQIFIALTKSAHSRLEKPYGTCTNDGSTVAEYYGNYSYTHSLCQHVCLQKLAGERCGCVDTLYPKLDNETYCETGKQMLCLLTLTHDYAAANSKKGNKMCECLAPCSYAVYKKTISYSNFPPPIYKVATGTQKQRDVLLGGQKGGRKGQGDDDWQDYENPATTTTVKPTDTTKKTSSGSGSASTSDTSTPTATASTAATTTTMTQCQGPYQFPPDSVKATVPGLDCTVKWPRIFTDPDVIVIRGYPCNSTKPCNTCIIPANPSSMDKFICSYLSYPGCSFKVKGYFAVLCKDFFANFDFIPLGAKVPNFTKWWESETTPLSADPVHCNSLSLINQDDCWRESVCKDNTTSADLTTPKEYPVPLDLKFMNKLTPTTTSCELKDLALDAANEHYTTTAGTSGRKKRSVSSTVDVPGFGSCEYANKNFKGKQHCIDWYKRNGLVIHVYFETLEVQTYTQGSTYPLVGLFTDVSGHAGMWLGLSVISIVELAHLLYMSIATLLFGNRINVANDDEIQSEVDNRERAAGEIEA